MSTKETTDSQGGLGKGLPSKSPPYSGVFGGTKKMASRTFEKTFSHDGPVQVGLTKTIRHGAFITFPNILSNWLSSGFAHKVVFLPKSVQL